LPGRALTATAEFSGGVGPYSVAWDLDGDLDFDDASGNPATATLPAGAHTVRGG